MPAVMAGPVTFAPPEGKSSKMAIIIAGFAAFGGFLYGYDTGYIAGVKAMPFWLRSAGQLGPDGKYMITTGQDSLVTSILSVGTFVGALLAYPIGDRFGRRIGIMIACAIFSVGVALQTASTTIPLFVVGRVFAGLGVGVASCLVPMYQSECAPKWIRGGVVACYQWAITIGLLVASVTVNATKDFNSANSYRIPIGIQFVWAAILVIGLAILPESPRYLLLKGREDEAWKSLSRLYSAPYDDPDVQAEFSEIMANLEKERSFGKTTLLDCFKTDKRKNLQRTLTGLGEIYPLATRGKQMAMSTASNWVVNFFIGFITPYLVDAGPGQAGLGVKVFWLWAALCFAALTFSFFLIPETKGLSLEQVDLLYTNSTVLKSNSYRTQLIANNLHEGMTPAEKAYQEKLEHI
ncbi:Solute carrier 2 (Facilitated glucose transporter) member 8 [Puccinia graminis f. sp. tritici]|uniref:Solute carrier 2 (Facilitated glucose transporter) member 8 n=1 Tax=Puccinia graminis f. sp. tritici TaxID=56615 RepID=A0A5B0PB59_PUCGR|nr:Solute carrier 2 (Facilitated glucose transporter) member 8 [Puccinia graminis f. sp. tritici]